MTQPDLARLAVSARADEMQRRLVEGTFYSDDYDQASADLRIIPELLARIAALEEALEGVLPYVEAERLAELARARVDRTARMPIRQAVKKARAALTLKENDDGR